MIWIKNSDLFVFAYYGTSGHPLGTPRVPKIFFFQLKYVSTVIKWHSEHKQRVFGVIGIKNSDFLVFAYYRTSSHPLGTPRVPKIFFFQLKYVSTFIKWHSEHKQRIFGVIWIKNSDFLVFAYYGTSSQPLGTPRVPKIIFFSIETCSYSFKLTFWTQTKSILGDLN